MREKRIVLATNNAHKLAEILRILGPLASACVPPRELAGEPPDPEENGGSYLENAAIKARAFARWSGLPALADDSGLEVAALDGAPGIFSARYAGERATGAENCRKLLAALRGRTERHARFVCALALAAPGGESLLEIQEQCAGTIAEGPRGDAGFGYDPIFIPEGRLVTFAEMSTEEKDRLSHRGRALARLRDRLR